jgi:hypothetical protein
MFRPIIILPAGAAALAANYWAEYTAIFGTPIVGQQVQIQAEYISLAGSKVSKYFAGAPVSTITTA